MQTTFFYLQRFLKKFADDQCSFITKGSIKRMYIQPFTTVGDWSEIGWLMEVSTMFYMFADTAFLLGTAELVVLDFIGRTLQ